MITQPKPVPAAQDGYTEVAAFTGQPTRSASSNGTTPVEVGVVRADRSAPNIATANFIGQPRPAIPPNADFRADLEARKAGIFAPNATTQAQAAALSQANSQTAAKDNAQQQAVRQSMYKDPQLDDWRVKLTLGANSDYLYKVDQTQVGILRPIWATNGVIFPYTPSIQTSYRANYEQYDLTHSNFRGVFYKSSRVDDIQIKAKFTAQDTYEANYLLAVIHFFRSVTKMFYGQDTQRGTPPPLVYLQGYGEYQFNRHPCLVSSFTYTLPTEVDYIRAIAPNNYGQSLLNRRQVNTAPFLGNQLSGARRLLNAIKNGLPKGAEPETPAPPPLEQFINNTAQATYVPTSMEIDINLIPVQTRKQISTQFSLKKFASGDLIKGGYW